MNSKIVYKAAVILAPACFVLAIGCESQDRNALGAGYLVGVITQARSGKPLEGAQVYLVGGRRVELTGPSGRYAIHNVRSRRYALVVELGGYHRISKEIQVLLHRMTRVDFRLSPQSATTPKSSTTASTAESPRRGPEPLVVGRAELILEVDDLNTATETVMRIITEAGARIERIDQNAGPGNVRRTTVTLSAPGSSFDEILESVRELGRVERLGITRQDAGAKALQMEARVDNLRLLEKRLLGIAAERHEQLEQLLATERELSRVRSDIQRFEAWLRRIESQGRAHAMLVMLHEPYPVIAARPARAGGLLKRAIESEADHFAHVIVHRIAALSYLLAVTVLFAPVFLLAKWYKSRRGRQGHAASTYQ